MNMIQQMFHEMAQERFTAASPESQSAIWASQCSVGRWMVRYLEEQEAREHSALLEKLWHRACPLAMALSFHLLTITRSTTNEKDTDQA